jgi:hypothetical protein
MPDNVSTMLTGKLLLWSYERLERMSAFVSVGCCQARSAAFWAEALAPASDAALALAGFEGGVAPPCKTPVTDTTHAQDTQLQRISKWETPTAFCALPLTSASCSCSHSSLAAQDIMYRPFLAYKGSKRREYERQTHITLAVICRTARFRSAASTRSDKCKVSFLPTNATTCSTYSPTPRALWPP